MQTVEASNGKRTRIVYSPEVKARCLTLIAEDHSLLEISQLEGVSVSTLANWKRDASGGEAGRVRKTSVKNLLTVLRNGDVKEQVELEIQKLRKRIEEDTANLALLEAVQLQQGSESPAF